RETLGQISGSAHTRPYPPRTRAATLRNHETIGTVHLCRRSRGRRGRRRVGPRRADDCPPIRLGRCRARAARAADWPCPRRNRPRGGAVAVLQASVGNLPELFVGIFSLRAGLVDLVRASLVGSILANSLLVFGIAMLVGGLKNGRQRFSREKARIGATMLLLAVSAIVIPTLVHELHAPAEAHIDALSGASAVLLLLSFGAGVFYLLSTKTDLPLLDATRRQMPEWSLERSVATLVVCGVLAAFVSEWFVAALEPMINILGLSQAFAGFVLVALAGNAVENVVGIQLALK